MAHYRITRKTLRLGKCIVGIRKRPVSRNTLLVAFNMRNGKRHGVVVEHIDGKSFCIEFGHAAPSALIVHTIVAVI